MDRELCPCLALFPAYLSPSTPLEVAKLYLGFGPPRYDGLNLQFSDKTDQNLVYICDEEPKALQLAL